MGVEGGVAGGSASDGGFPQDANANAQINTKRSIPLGDFRSHGSITQEVRGCGDGQVLVH